MNPAERTTRQQRDDASELTADRPMSVADIRESYADLADWQDRFDVFDRLLTGRYRRRQFGDARGHVLDVACGIGTNFPHLPESAELVGVDISSDMLVNASDRLDDLGRDGALHQMDAQSLSFSDDTFDTVVSALSTCTFPDPVAALDEMARVCKPDGRILLLEHGRSDVGPVARYQEWRADAHYAKAGCQWTQEPLDHVAAADLSVDATDTAFLGMITTVEATPG